MTCTIDFVLLLEIGIGSEDKQAMMTRQPLRVCYFGTYRTNYARNTIIIDGLRANGVEVIECHEPLWRSFEDRDQVANGGWRHPVFWWRVVRTYVRLLWRFGRLKQDYDLMVVAYLGQFDVLLARVLSWWQRKPLVWDILMAISLIARERNLDRRRPLTMSIIHQVERLACCLPDQLISDTRAYIGWFGATYGVAPERFTLVPIGADNRVFRPADPRDEEDPQRFVVVYYGTFIPNHGVASLIEAARLLRAYGSIVFECIGDGPDKALAQGLTARYGLTNVTFIKWMHQDDLARRVARAGVSLGSFGMTPQSLLTVHNKIYEGMAMAVPIITGDSPAVHEMLVHGEHVYLCERANPHALASAILRLYLDDDLRRKLARQGYAYYQRHFTLEQIGAQFQQALIDVCNRDG
ncbi:MAG: glycosyltransferase family 4 protein [Chloroflexaceae bacterium]|nr:glycosyltransferase family 4 protein [Chloroflexaceae bacterium]